MSERNIAQMFEGPAHNWVWKNRYNEIIDEVYDKYDELFDSYYPAFSAPYPKRLTKEELAEIKSIALVRKGSGNAFKKMSSPCKEQTTGAPTSLERISAMPERRALVR